VTSKEDLAAFRELRRVVRAERPREELIPIFERLRNRIFRENSIQELGAFLEEYDRYKEEAEKYKQSLQQQSQFSEELFKRYVTVAEKYIDRSWEYFFFVIKYKKARQALDTWRAITVLGLSIIVIALMIFVFTNSHTPEIHLSFESVRISIQQLCLIAIEISGLIVVILILWKHIADLWRGNNKS
jgi:hypothetical protein